MSLTLYSMILKLQWTLESAEELNKVNIASPHIPKEILIQKVEKEPWNILMRMISSYTF